ncbi:MAG TPA: hypothetical protein VK957_03590, partial [Lunatimonas sp.]|nr:hypothetical protein [Lunatimonas sp.]
MDSIETSDTYEKYIGKLNLNLAIFWGSFFVFVFCAGVLQVHIIPLFIPLNILQTLSILAMVYASFNLVQFNVKNEVVGILIFCYFAWCFYIIFNGFVYEYDFIKYQIFGGFLKYFFPIVLFFPKTIRFYKFQFNVVFFGAVGFILINLIFFEQVTTNYEDNVNEKFTFEGFVKNLGISIGFILFTFIYHSKIKVTISLVGLFMIIGIATYRARRAVMLVAIVHLMI